MNRILDIANVAPELRQIADLIERRKMEACAYTNRMDMLRSNDNIFGTCKTTRAKKKYRNRVHSEKAGTIAPRLTTKRFDDSHTTIVCRTTSIY